jgi:hypothetical protein
MTKKSENYKDIARDIISLAKELDNAEDLKEAWRIISPAFVYLSKKDDLFSAEQRAQDTIMEENE